MDNIRRYQRAEENVYTTGEAIFSSNQSSVSLQVTVKYNFNKNNRRCNLLKLTVKHNLLNIVLR